MTCTSLVDVCTGCAHWQIEQTHMPGGWQEVLAIGQGQMWLTSSHTSDVSKQVDCVPIDLLPLCREADETISNIYLRICQRCLSVNGKGRDWKYRHRNSQMHIWNWGRCVYIKSTTVWLWYENVSNQSQLWWMTITNSQQAWGKQEDGRGGFMVCASQQEVWRKRTILSISLFWWGHSVRAVRTMIIVAAGYLQTIMQLQNCECWRYRLTNMPSSCSKL